MMRLNHLLVLSLLLLAFYTQGSSQAIQKNLGELSVTTIHQKMALGTLSSADLVSFYIQRIEAFDKNSLQLQSIAQLNPNALSQAINLDKTFKRSGLTGPLHGIPVLLKDNIDTGDGMANTAGSHALAQNFPVDDAFLVQRLRQAGAIILGKTNLSEWANFRSTSSSSGWSGLWGQAKNPYDTTASPCGSSSGSAIAVAANFATLAVGTETDGSVTCPSAMNGIVGIKPTLGTVSRDGIIPIAHSQDTAGPMARTVTDAVILLTSMVAADKNDAGVLASNIDYLSHLQTDGLKGKRIGIARNLMGYHKGLDAVFEQAISDLKRQGAIIIEQTNFDNNDQWGDPEFEVLLFEFKHNINKYLVNTADGIPKSLSELIQYNENNSTIEMPYFAQELFEMAESKGDLNEKIYLDALKKAKNESQNKGIDLLIKKYALDLIIAPTTGPAWKIDWINGDHYSGASSSAAAISGYPHITVPMGYVHHLPVGLSFFSGKLAEGNLIEAAYAFEQATKHRQPPSLQ
jgi:amidase/aspartyl-tRNA(Asn)/glutamyl-tRNA(Gln) amidotransferase subunit A